MDPIEVHWRVALGGGVEPIECQRVVVVPSVCVKKKMRDPAVIFRARGQLKIGTGERGPMNEDTHRSSI